MNALTTMTMAAMTCALLLGGCSGEARPFEEAVEVGELGLRSLEIRAPDGTLSPLVVSAGERLRFTLVGRDAAGVAFEVPGDARSWRVSNGNVAGIDDDGVLVARSDGTVAVGITIGGITAPELDVTVSSAALASIDAINGPETVEPCVAERYVAVGRFADDSVRSLPSVRWSADTSDVRLGALEDGSVTLSATRPGQFALTASVNEASLPKTVSVADTLRAIVIGPSTRAATVGDDQALSATGSYESEGTVRDRLITDAVDWSVPSGTEVASVDNEPPDRGRVSAEAVGTAQIRAACGDVADVVTFTAQEDTTGEADGDGLSFDGVDDDGVLTILASGGAFQIGVSTGDSYNAADDVADRVRWTLIDDGQQNITLITDGDNAGQISPLTLGEDRIRVTFGATATATLLVQVI